MLKKLVGIIKPNGTGYEQCQVYSCGLQNGGNFECVTGSGCTFMGGCCNPYPV